MTGVNCIVTGIYDVAQRAFRIASDTWYSLQRPINVKVWKFGPKRDIPKTERCCDLAENLTRVLSAGFRLARVSWVSAQCPPMR